MVTFRMFTAISTWFFTFYTFLATFLSTIRMRTLDLTSLKTRSTIFMTFRFAAMVAYQVSLTFLLTLAMKYLTFTIFALISTLISTFQKSTTWLRTTYIFIKLVCTQPTFHISFMPTFQPFLNHLSTRMCIPSFFLLLSKFITIISTKFTTFMATFQLSMAFF